MIFHCNWKTLPGSRIYKYLRSMSLLLIFFKNDLVIINVSYKSCSYVRKQVSLVWGRILGIMLIRLLENLVF